MNKYTRANHPSSRRPTEISQNITFFTGKLLNVYKDVICIALEQMLGTAHRR